jgi:hypothetical protein
MNKLLLAYNTPKKQIRFENSYKINIAQKHGGLCNQLWTLVIGLIVCIKQGISVLYIGSFLLDIHTRSYCPIGMILSLPAMNDLLTKYNIRIEDGSRINERNTPGLNVLLLGWEILYEPANIDLKVELFRLIRFSQSIFTPALKFVNDIQSNRKKGTINVVHLRIEQDWLDHVSSGRNPRVSPAVVSNEIVDKYINFIQRYIKKDDTTFILSGSSSNKVIDYLRNHGYTYFLFPKITPYREMNAAMDMVIGKTCNNVFIGCGGSSFSDILLHRITGDNIQKYLC